MNGFADTSKPAPKKIVAECPSCSEVGEFKDIGAMEFPQIVLERHGLKRNPHLYDCPHCLTTVMEGSLQPLSVVRA